MSIRPFRFIRGALHLPEIGLWLDAHDPVTGPERVFVSHAHSDHTASHREVIASEATARLMAARIGRHPEREHLLPWLQPTEFTGPERPFRITLIPAGHIFGSAMSRIEWGGRSLLYTGDFKLRAGRSAERCDPVAARPIDVLVMETTYGRPIYEFPPAEEVLRGVIRFCREALDHEETPVLLGYSLGKSQELLSGLADAGLPLMLHPSVERLTRIYEDLGQVFPPYTTLDPARAGGHVLVLPPGVTPPAGLRGQGRARTAVLTGWAIDPGCRFRHKADAAFALSDHADYPDLIEFVRQVRPRQVYTLHGFAADFAATLRQLGFPAEALSEQEQLSLDLLTPTPTPTPTPTRTPPAPDGAVRKALTLRETAPAMSATADAATAATAKASTADPVAEPAPDTFAAFAETCGAIAATSGKLDKVARLARYLGRLDAASVPRGPASPEDLLRRTVVWFSGLPFAATENRPIQTGWALLRDAIVEAAGVDLPGFRQVYLKHSDTGETAAELIALRPPPGPRPTQSPPIPILPPPAGAPIEPEGTAGPSGTDRSDRPNEPNEPTGPNQRLTLLEVARLFHELADARGPAHRQRLLAQAFARCAPMEARYLAKIITGDLRIGLKEGLVEEAMARAFAAEPDAVRQAHLVLGHLGDTAVLAARRALDQAGLTPFRPVRFMLASPEPGAHDIWQRLGGTSRETNDPAPNDLGLTGSGSLDPGSPGYGPQDNTPTEAATTLAGGIWVEDKYDGIRCQLHRAGGRAALFSRDLKDISAAFPEIVQAAARDLADDVVVDGELLAVRDDQVLPFADLQRRLGRREGDLFLGGEIPVRLLAFDLLWRNGRTLLEAPLSARRAELEAVPWPDAIQAAPIRRARSVEDLEAAFVAARERGNEGLMAKDPASAYLPGRRGLAWLKLKKALATLDCVVIGAEYGHGRRKDLLSDYTFAVRDEATGALRRIGKAYTGLTDAEMAGLTRHFLQRTVRRKGRYHEVVPDTVLEIAFDRIQLSARHDSGLALRFPRIVRVRPDKAPDQIDTVANARRLVQDRS